MPLYVHTRNLVSIIINFFTFCLGEDLSSLDDACTVEIGHVISFFIGDLIFFSYSK